MAKAHAEGSTAQMARHDLFDRYCGAAWRYMLAVTRDEQVAEELFQEFSLRLIRGDFFRALDLVQRGVPVAHRVVRLAERPASEQPSTKAE